MEKAVATTGANPRAPGPRAPGNRDTLMVGQTVHPDIPNEATLQAYGAYVESDESDDESIFSINSLPNLLSESSDDESSDDDTGSVHNMTDDETATDVEPSESAWKIISDEAQPARLSGSGYSRVLAHQPEAGPNQLRECFIINWFTP